MKVVLGLDGGGTKTQTVVLNEEKKVLGTFTSACSNHNSVGFEVAHTNLKASIEGAMKEAGVSPADVAGIILSMSGVDRPSDKETVGKWIHEIFPSTIQYGIYNDACAALASGTEGDLYGIVVISGTGTIAYGFNKEGATARAQGWGPTLGDCGSGYDIGYEVLKAVCRAKDGMAPPTLLTSTLLTFLGLEKEDDLIPWAYKKDEGWHRIASLAAVAHQCAKQKDPKAIEIIDAAAQNLLDAVKAVAQRINLPTTAGANVPLVLAGGNLDHDDSLLGESLCKIIAKHCPGINPTRPHVPPAVGAALLSLKMTLLSK